MDLLLLPLCRTSDDGNGKGLFRTEVGFVSSCRLIVAIDIVKAVLCEPNTAEDPIGMIYAIQDKVSRDTLTIVVCSLDSLLRRHFRRCR